MLHAGSKLVVGGASKSFKTWTLLYLAAAVSSGQPWLGFKTFQSRVLFINFELARFSIQRRLQSITRALGIKPDDRFFSLWNLRGYSAPYQVLVPQIVDRIKTIQTGS
jgi:RecA-family ATPase